MVWGIIRLRLFNEALLGKWLWHYGLERDALWGRVIEVKYGSVLWGGGWVGLCTSPVLGPYRVSLWRTIRHGWPSLSCHIQYEVGDGTREILARRTKRGEFSCCMLPELFRICRNEEASVADFMQFINGVLHWDLHFMQAIQD